MKKYTLPTRKQCLNLLKEHHVPSHILKHSLAVTKLAVFLAERLKEKGLPVDVNLIDRACLLHDIVRICDFKELDYSKFQQNIAQESKVKWQQIKERFKGISHEDAAYNLLKEKYPVLALAVKKHRYVAVLDEKEKPTTWEEKLVYYADKRVMHDRIVPLKERLEEAHRRYAARRRANAKTTLDTAKIDRLIYKLEKEIFDKVGLDPLQVTAEFIRRTSGGFIDSYPSRRRKRINPLRQYSIRRIRTQHKGKV
jgi:putative nucleotidyltransferase with HDIG domain